MDIFKQVWKNTHINSGKEKKQYVLFAVAMLALLFFEIVLYFAAVQPRAEDVRIMDNQTPHITSSEQVTILSYKSNNKTYEQLVRSEKPLGGVAILLGTYDNEFVEGRMTVRLYDGKTEQLLETNTLSLEDAVDNSYYKLFFSRAYDTESDLYLITITPQLSEDEGMCAIWMTKDKDDFFPKQATVNGKSLKAYFNIRPMYTAEFLPGFYWAIAGGLLLFVFEAFFIIKRFRKVQYVFLVCAILFGFLYMLVYPSYAVFDEERHIPAAFARASAWSQGQWDVERGADIQIREEEERVEFVTTRPKIEQYYYLTENIFNGAESNEYVEIEMPTHISYSHEYIPQTLGVLLARTFNMGQTATLYTAQMVALIFYSVLCYFAISISPYPVLFSIISLFPFFLRTMGSFSYDSMVNALSFLVIAYILRLAKEKTKVKRKDILIISALFVLLAPCKVIYTTLVLLILLIPSNNFKQKRQKFIWLASITGICLLVILLSTGFYFENSFGETGVVTSPWGEDAYSVSMLLSMPWEFIRITVSSMFDLFASLLFGAVGNFQHISLPSTLSILFLAIALISVGSLEENPIIKHEKWFYFFVLFLVIGLGYGASLRWTAVGLYHYKGMQARYLVPVLPLFFLLFKGTLAKTINKDMLLFAVICLNAYSVLYTFAQVIW